MVFLVDEKLPQLNYLLDTLTPWRGHTLKNRCLHQGDLKSALLLKVSISVGKEHKP